ncbi:MAG: extracellular solute-binding protein [Candidatus Omnitrophica bacterium]|nr:extracellular solute-binding protein [Candidatus Omnitrophota bacterium]
MLKRESDPTKSFGLVLIFLALGLVGCSTPREEVGESSRPSEDMTPAIIEEPTETSPMGPISLSLPDWVTPENRDALIPEAKQAVGDRDLIVQGPGERDVSVGLYPEDRVEDGTPFPWIEEHLYLYANKVLLARAGVQSIPKTWDEVLGAVDHKDRIEGLTAFFALPGDSNGMFRTISLLSALCGATSFSHPEEETICVAVEGMGDLNRKGDYVLDHEKGLSGREAIQELGRGKAAMALAWESEAEILNDTQTSSVASQIKAASPPSFEVHGIREPIQPTRKWHWVVNSASAEDEAAVKLAKRLSEWRGANPPFGAYVDASTQESTSVVKGGLFELHPPNDHAIRETRRILLEGFKNRQSGLEILKGIQIRYVAIREHETK